MKCVIDTNGLLRSIPKNGNYRWLFDAWKQNKFSWIISNEIISEYVEVIEREFSLEAATIVVDIILSSVNHLRVESSYKWQLVENDPDDNKFVDCTISASADYLITDDKDILRLREIPDLFPPLTIVTFEEFRKILKA
jgi:uncharacterized protein